jgi:flagellar hook-associated protein 2
MSDISIPGTGTDKYGTQKLIEALMKAERVPRDKAADQIKSLETQRSVWIDFNQRLSVLRTGAQGLYSFKNPFDERVAKSSDEETLAAVATRAALEQTRTILVKKAAAADRFLSAELPKDYKVPAGAYAFTVGDKRVELRFSGGSLQEFADALTRKGGELIRAQVVSVKSDTRSLVVESLKTGAAFRLGFEGDAVKLALEAKIVERVQTTKQELDPKKAAAWERPLPQGALASGTLALAAGGEAKLAFSPPVKTAGMVLEVEYRVSRLPEGVKAAPPTGPSLSEVGSATFGGVTVTGEPAATALPEWTPPPSPPLVQDLSMASVIGADGARRPLPDLVEAEGKQTLRVELDGYGSSASGIGFRVRDTTRALEVLAVRVFDPSEAGGFRPVKPVSTAQDAVVSVDGIEVVRPTNSIADVVPGVTLNVKAASEKSVILKVGPDREKVQEAIVAFVGNYNKLMAQINILSRSDEKVISEITYFTDDEKKAAKERLGSLQGDSTLGLLSTALQRAMQAAYETKDGRDMSLLAQLGISTNAARPGAGGGFDSSRLRGYLEIEDEVLGKGLGEHFEAARQLFGNDTNGDLIADSGAAYAIDSLLKPYVETGGIISLKTGTIDRQLGSTSQPGTLRARLADMDVQLARKEQELKQKYGSMESSLNKMESASSSIDNFSKQNSSGQ